MTTPQAALPLRVLCVDDNEELAESLRRRFATEKALAWAGVVLHGSEVLARVAAERPDIVLMDIDMPETDPFDLLVRITEQAPRTRVLMFSGHVSREYIDRALDCGAWGYLSKNDEVEGLIEQIVRAGQGHFVFSKEVLAVQRAGKS